MLRLVFAELRKIHIGFTRQWVESLVGLVLVGLFLYGVLSGSSLLINREVIDGETRSAFVAGFLAWMLALGGMNHSASEAQNDIAQGTIEQVLFLGRGAMRIYLSRGIAGAAHGLVTTSVLATIGLLATGYRLQIPLSAVPFILALLVSSIGLGMILSAFCLMIRKISVLTALLNVLLIPFFMSQAASSGSPALWFVPMVPAVAGLKLLVAGGSFDLGLLLAASLNGLATLALGVFATRRLELMARRVPGIGFT